MRPVGNGRGKDVWNRFSFFLLYYIHISICITTQRGPSVVEEAKMCGIGFPFSINYYVHISICITTQCGPCADFVSPNMFRIIHVCAYIYTHIDTLRQRAALSYIYVYIYIYIYTYIYI